MQWKNGAYGACAAGLCLWVASEASLSHAKPPATRPVFANPVYSGADPWITRQDGHYYLCQSTRGRGISVWKSSKLSDRGTERVVWRAPRRGWNSAEVWAPELHHIQGRWYIYYAASDGRNANHRMGVLESVTDDPQGEYIDKGMLYTGDDVAGRTNNRWAIDGTVLEVDQRLYFIWSGWEDERDVQYLYIAPMKNPWTIGGNRVRICANNMHVWERVGEDQRQRGLNEGPQVLTRNGQVFIVYSCSGAWQASYKLGLLRADLKADLLDPASWTKLPRPVFRATDEVFGVGHCCFATSPDGREDWIIYHAKVSAREGWERVVRMQPFTWTAENLPDFGRPVPSGAPLPVPSGEERKPARDGASDTSSRVVPSLPVSPEKPAA